MKAWRIHDNGEPGSVYRLEEVATPVPRPGQVRVKVLAAALNYPDVMMARGHYQLQPPLPFTPGVELCGEVIELGPDVTRFRVGDRLVGTAQLPSGSFAEESLMSAETAQLAPLDLDDAHAAGLHIAYQTGWFGLHRRAQLREGETLLVHARPRSLGNSAAISSSTARATTSSPRSRNSPAAAASTSRMTRSAARHTPPRPK